MCLSRSIKAMWPSLRTKVCACSDVRRTVATVHTITYAITCEVPVPQIRVQMEGQARLEPAPSIDAACVSGQILRKDTAPRLTSLLGDILAWMECQCGVSSLGYSVFANLAALTNFSPRTTNECVLCSTGRCICCTCIVGLVECGVLVDRPPQVTIHRSWTARFASYCVIRVLVRCSST